MSYVIRRAVDGRELFWIGPTVDPDQWGIRAQAFEIMVKANADDTAQRLSRRFSGQLFVEATS